MGEGEEGARRDAEQHWRLRKEAPCSHGVRTRNRSIAEMSVKVRRSEEVEGDIKKKPSHCDVNAFEQLYGSLLTCRLAHFLAHSLFLTCEISIRGWMIVAASGTLKKKESIWSYFALILLCLSHMICRSLISNEGDDKIRVCGISVVSKTRIT
jgi:hypothetical protein